jgi:hypothetical protein
MRAVFERVPPPPNAAPRRAPACTLRLSLLRFRTHIRVLHCRACWFRAALPYAVPLLFPLVVGVFIAFSCAASRECVGVMPIKGKQGFNTIQWTLFL